MKALYLSSVGLLLLASCSNHIYIPNTVNEPLLKERYEFKGNISPSNLQAAFALTDHIAIMANGQYVYHSFDWGNHDNDDLFIDKNTRGGVIEGAVGYFTPLDQKKRMVFDVYAGYSNGSFKTLAGDYNNSNAVPDDYLLRTHFSKLFIQPGIGFSHPIIEAAFTSRVSLLNFYSLYAGPKAFENDDNRRANYLQVGNRLVPLYEPAFTFRVGYKYVKFQMQLLFSVLINDERYSGYEISEYFQPVSLGMGVSVDLGRWYDSFRKKGIK